MPAITLVVAGHPFSITPRRAGIVTLQLLGFQLGLGVVIGGVIAIWNAIPGLPPAPASSNPMAVAIGNLVAFAIVLGRECRRCGVSFRTLGRWHVRPLLLVVPLVLMVGGVSVLISETENVIRALAPEPAWLLQFFESFSDMAAHPFGALFCLSVVAPITEELIFRGLILRGLLTVATPARAIMISAALFAAIHLNPWQFPVALVYGVLLGWIYLRTQSLTLCILAHALNNTLSLLASGLPFIIEGFNTERAPGAVLFQPWWFDACGALLLMCGCVLFHRLAPSSQLPPPRPAEPPLLAQRIVAATSE